ncbi:MAG: DUF1559 domain-containing protein [Planctomycetota bacterium]|nr:DUF1559 domain-containing protein [Planctomycetota bacterium]
MDKWLRYPKIAYWITGGILIAVVLFGGLSQFRDIKLKTNLLAEPLQANGQVDFLQSFKPHNPSPSMATDQNGFRLLIKNMDVSQNVPAPHLKRLYFKVGLDPAKLQGLSSYIDPYEYSRIYFNSKTFDASLVRQLQLREGALTPTELTELEGKKIEEYEVTEFLTARSHKPWTRLELPMFENWVHDNAPVLDVCAKAVRLPSFEIPLSYLSDTNQLLDFPYMPIMFRAIARGYAARANYYLGHGNVRKAMDDVLSCKRLGRHIRNRNTSSFRLLGIAIEGIADSIGIINAVHDLSTKDDLYYFVEEWKAIPPVTNLEILRDYEKRMLQNGLQKISQVQGLTQFEDLKQLKGVAELENLRNLGLNWNLVFTEFHLTYEKHAGDMNWLEKEIETVAFQLGDYFSLAARSRKFARLFVAMTTGNYITEAESRAHCLDRLKRISTALLLYEKEKGALPPAFTTDNSGQKLQSWRVLLLPYLGLEELYKKILLNEPWDSVHNSRFDSQCPKVFTCPSCTERNFSHTNFSLVLGPQLPFEGAQGKSLNQWGPDCDDMILVAERTAPVPWMNPAMEILQADAELGITGAGDDDKAQTPVGSPHFGGANFAFRNGAAIFISEHQDLQVFKQQLRGTNHQWWD